MTEQEWLECDDIRELLEYLVGRASASSGCLGVPAVGESGTCWSMSGAKTPCQSRSGMRMTLLPRKRWTPPEGRWLLAGLKRHYAQEVQRWIVGPSVRQRPSFSRLLSGIPVLAVEERSRLLGRRLRQLGEQPARQGQSQRYAANCRCSLTFLRTRTDRVGWNRHG